jgi:group I intron endonuclease
MQMTSGVYWIYQISQDRAVYVGSSATIEDRIKGHQLRLVGNRHPNRRLQFTWNKYGAADFRLERLEDVGVERMVEREQFWMDAMPVWPTCNIAIAADNPMRGRHMSDESRRKIGDAFRGKHLSEEHKRKLSVANKGNQSRLGMVCSEEHKRRSSESNRGKPHLAARGRIVSEETKRKIGDANRGHVVTEEQREKLRAANLGKTQSEETKLKRSMSAKGHHRLLGRKLSEEHKRKIGAALVGRIVLPETGRKISETKRARNAACKVEEKE